MNEHDERPLFAVSAENGDELLFPSTGVGGQRRAPTTIVQSENSGPPPRVLADTDPPLLLGTPAATKTQSTYAGDAPVPPTQPSRPARRPRRPAQMVVGVVNGAVTSDPVVHTSWGPRTLLLSLAVPLASLAVSANARSSRSMILLAIMAVVVMIAAAAVLVSALGRGSSNTGRRPRVPGLTSWERTVCRFRIEAMSGETVACVIGGRLDGDRVRPGDTVRVDGRQSRDGYLDLRSVEVLESMAGPTVTRMRGGRGPIVMMSLWNGVAFALAAAVGLWSVIVLMS